VGWLITLMVLATVPSSAVVGRMAEVATSNQLRRAADLRSR
jgi:hypothetical protein